MKRSVFYRLSAISIAVCLSIGINPLWVNAANDVSDHWASAYINKLEAQNVLSGYQDGTMRPNEPITRAEFITMVNKVFGFVEKSNNRFSDISIDDWFLPEMQKALKAGYITGYDGFARPNAPITREEAAVAMYRAFDLPSEEVSLLQFTDKSDISIWAEEAVASLVGNKLINGYPDGSFRPKGSITRAEAATIMSLFAGDIYSKEGTYFGKGATVKQNVIINTPDVILANITIDGDLYIAPGVDEGNVTLDNVTVLGNTHVFGGGVNSIYIMDSRLGKVRIEKKNEKPVRLVYVGNSKTKEISTRTDTTIETGRLRKDADGIDKITIPKDVINEVRVTLSGIFKLLEIEGNANINLLEGSIQELLVIGDVKATITAIKGAVIKSLLADSDIKINGKTIAAGVLTVVTAIGDVVAGVQATPVPTAVPTAVPTQPTGEGLTTVTPVPEPAVVTVDYMGIITAPKTEYYVGESLDLSGLVVLLSMSDGTTKEVAFINFAANGLSTDPEDGYILSLNDSIVTITHNGSGISTTQSITVTKPVDSVLSLVTVDPISLTASGNVTATPRNAAGEAITSGDPISYSWLITGTGTGTTAPALTGETTATVSVDMDSASRGTYTLTVTASQNGLTYTADVTVTVEGVLPSYTVMSSNQFASFGKATVFIELIGVTAANAANYVVTYNGITLSFDDYIGGYMYEADEHETDGKNLAESAHHYGNVTVSFANN